MRNRLKSLFAIIKIAILTLVTIPAVALAEFPTQGFDNYVREKLKWENTGIADRASDIIQHGLMFTPAIIAVQQDRGLKHVGAVIAGQGVAAGITQIVKVQANRLRPDGTDRRSFFSGHTSSAFSSAAVGCVLDKNFCAPGYVLAAATGYLRIAADKHWASDVLMGAIVGTASGKFIPGIFVTF